eukprot:390155-Rhodomonas_salina.2
MQPAQLCCPSLSLIPRSCFPFAASLAGIRNEHCLQHLDLPTVSFCELLIVLWLRRLASFKKPAPSSDKLVSVIRRTESVKLGVPREMLISSSVDEGEVDLAPYTTERQTSGHVREDIPQTSVI